MARKSKVSAKAAKIKHLLYTARDLMIAAGVFGPVTKPTAKKPSPKSR